MEKDLVKMNSLQNIDKVCGIIIYLYVYVCDLTASVILR